MPLYTKPKLPNLSHRAFRWGPPWSYFELRRLPRLGTIQTMTAASAEQSSLSSKRSWNLKAELSSICLNAGGAESAPGSIKAAQLAASRSQNIPSPRIFPQAAAGNCQIGKSGSGRRKGTGINGFLLSGSAVQRDKVDQHHPVRRLTVVFGFGENGALVG